MGRLEGKVAIITGAARGQGRATAELFASEGATPILTDVLDQEGAAAAREIGGKARYRHLDVTSEDDWSALVAETVEELGRVDVLVNIAAITWFSPITETPKADFEKVLSINLTGCFLGMKTAGAQMTRQKHGAIVNISSVNGLRGTMGMSAYDASKWGVRGMTKAAALEFAPLGIRVNSVHPGAIDTPMLNPDGDLDPVEMAREYGIAFGRVGRPREVAHATLFLASDEASYISGAELTVDGTWTAGLLVNSTSLGHI